MAISCKGDNSKTTVAKDPVKVKVIRVEKQATRSNKTYVGRVESATDINISSPFSAKLVSIKVKPGQKVKEGDILAELYSEHIETMFTSAQATVNQAQDAYDRLLKVKDNGSVSELKMVEVQTQLSKAQAALRSAAKSKEDCIIRAPMSGTVGEIKAKTGEDLSPMQQIIRLIDLERLEIAIDVPEMELSLYGKGSEALVCVPALGEDTIPANLTEKGVSSSVLGHSYKCKLSLSSCPEDLRPGMIAKVSFCKEEQEAFVIPSSIVRRDGQGTYLWLVNADGTVRKGRITTGDFSGSGVIVESGLQAGDRVVCEGMSKISTGMRVSITE
ncbi:MAG: efflux RND transporter periplasmic adaptor subunit [Candidatus Cryptobacteroides sp.]